MYTGLSFCYSYFAHELGGPVYAMNTIEDNYYFSRSNFLKYQMPRLHISMLLAVWQEWYFDLCFAMW